MKAAEPMKWKPDRRQIDLIAEYGNAHMPIEAIAAALDVHPDDLRAWKQESLQQRVCAGFLSQPHRQLRPQHLATGLAGSWPSVFSRRKTMRRRAASSEEV